MSVLVTIFFLGGGCSRVLRVHITKVTKFVKSKPVQWNEEVFFLLSKDWGALCWMDLSYLYVPLNCRVVEIPPPSLRGCDTNACTFTCNKIEFCTIWLKTSRRELTCGIWYVYGKIKPSQLKLMTYAHVIYYVLM